MRRLALPALLLLVAAPLAAKDSLGIFSDWGAFREPSVPQCYAIAEAEESPFSREFDPYATIATWPARRIRGQVHFRLSRPMRQNSRVSLRIGRQTFTLTGGSADAWARDAAMDAAIVAAMRSADAMTVRGTDTRGRRFSDRYSLAGAATAMDAATLACPRR
ncbi:invasion associated locus B family protein [Qipengyuania sp. 1NDW9]|uniref:invasion associated locus B family protein n=1 Tax=Qipengyuania xiapuensis TaxID=2867236 RepID=UPI001C8807E2|nr:invasion associated locus B family protein [Qipengyuania xiapuensis]MBX7492934.1 invasion associated locus B family protein [Qipengyuania xiapuensis]